MDFEKPPPPLVIESSNSEPRPNRAERLMEAMHPVFSHDLSNQLVVVQSLAHLLELEEKQNLSPKAQEYLIRLIGASQRAGSMVQFLKQMARLNHLQEPIEAIQLPYMAREIQAEVNQLFRDQKLFLETQWEEPMVYAGRRSLHQAILEVLRCGIGWFAGAALDLRILSRNIMAGVEMELAVSPRTNGDEPPPRHDQPKVENRMGLCLARELAATWGGTLEVVAAGPSFLVRLLIPKPVGST
jgi:light-regulated signal transduction histidine kinase (bacteriophytochrome)